MNSGLCLDTIGRPSDGIAGPVLAAVLEAALAIYDELTGLDGPCAAGIVSGAAAAVDRGLDCGDGCQGMLWVRLESLYPSRNFPEADSTPFRGEMSWAAVVELGVVRAAPMLRGEGPDAQLPTMAEEEAAADRSNVDGAVLREALLVRYADEQDVGIVLGSWVPFGPDGGVVGGALTATIQIV